MYMCVFKVHMFALLLMLYSETLKVIVVFLLTVELQQECSDVRRQPVLVICLGGGLWLLNSGTLVRKEH